MGVREEITERIIQALESGVPPWRAGWSSGSLAFNALTGTPYKGINQLLLGMAGFEDSRYLTLKQANKMGYRVRKGEKATKIVRLVEVERCESSKDEPEDQVGQEEGKALVMRTYDVFNASQIEGMPPLPKRARKVDPVEAADAVINGLKATGLVLLEGGTTPSYSPKMDVIRMPRKEDFHSTNDYYATLLHEASHSTGNPKRLNRPMLGARFGSVEYAKEELRVEIAAAMLGAEVGIPISQQQIDSHAGYVQSWLEALKQDKNEIFRAAAQAHQIVEYLQEQAFTPEPDAIKPRIPAQTLVSTPQSEITTAAPAVMATKSRSRPALRPGA